MNFMMNMKKSGLLILALAVAPASQAKDLRIGVALANFDLNFISILRTQMAKEMEKEQIQGQFEDAKGDVAVQVQQVENFINQAWTRLSLIRWIPRALSQ
jgi:ribose transport system substrate-binding protein